MKLDQKEREREKKEKILTIPTRKAAKRTKKMTSVQDLFSIGPSSKSSCDAINQYNFSMIGGFFSET